LCNVDESFLKKTKQREKREKELNQALAKVTKRLTSMAQIKEKRRLNERNQRLKA